jgi:DNA modification methylase/DNA-binding XRE family transcriptional regulator
MSQMALTIAANIALPTVKKLEAGGGTVASLLAVMAALDHRFSTQNPGEDIGRWLVRERRRTRLSQQTLCRMAGLAKPSVIQVERNKGHMNSLAAIMQALRLPISLVPNEQEVVGLERPLVRIHVGDCREILHRLPTKQFHACITSPPYFQQRDYGVEGQVGLDASEEEYIRSVIEVMRGVKRVLRDDGTLWLVIGDSFTRSGSGSARRRKELLGLPWRVAFALQQDGWHLRQEIILVKKAPLPEPVKDRFVRAHEYLFLLTKRQRYWFDASAVRERGVTTNAGSAQRNTKETHGNVSGGNTGLNAAKERLRREIEETGFSTRYKRSVWTISSPAGRYRHYAAFPEDLVKTCIKAGCPEGGAVLDPFAGSGTAGAVARRLNRSADLIELNPQYAEVARKRCTETSNKSKGCALNLSAGTTRLKYR